MAVILTILKIIGIILLCILGLLLLILLMVLLIPIRYLGDGGYTSERVGAKLRIRWFIVKVLVNYNKGDPFTIKAKVGPFTVYSMSSGEEPEEGHLTLPDDTPKDTQKDAKEDAKKETSEDSPDSSASSVSSKEKASDEKTGGTAGEEETGKDAAKVLATDTGGMPGLEETGKEVGKEAGKRTEDTSTAQQDPAKKDIAIETLKEGAKGTSDELLPGTPQDLSTGATEEIVVKSEEDEFFDKVEQFLNKIETKKSHIQQFLERDATKRTIQRGKKLLVKILRHLKPRKGHVDLHLGLGSAADTGMILAKLGKYYPLYGSWLIISPDFYNKVIEVEGMVKGRIRIGSLAVPALIFYLRKDTRRTIKLAKKI